MPIGIKDFYFFIVINVTVESNALDIIEPLNFKVKTSLGAFIDFW